MAEIKYGLGAFFQYLSYYNPSGVADYTPVVGPGEPKQEPTAIKEGGMGLGVYGCVDLVFKRGFFIGGKISPSVAFLSQSSDAPGTKFYDNKVYQKSTPEAPSIIMVTLTAPLEFGYQNDNASLAIYFSPGFSIRNETSPGNIQNSIAPYGAAGVSATVGSENFHAGLSGEIFGIGVNGPDQRLVAFAPGVRLTLGGGYRF